MVCHGLSLLPSLVSLPCRGSTNRAGPSDIGRAVGVGSGRCGGWDKNLEDSAPRVPTVRNNAGVQPLRITDLYRCARTDLAAVASRTRGPRVPLFHSIRHFHGQLDLHRRVARELIEADGAARVPAGVIAPDLQQQIGRAVN